MEGNLQKWTNYLFGWRERYFVLKNSILYYYLKKGDKPKARVHLGVCQINSPENENKIEIDTGISTIFIKAEDKTQKDQWLKALRAAKRESENKIQNTMLNLNNSMNNLNFSQNMNLQNSVRYDNYDSSTNRNSVITEDKLLRKINSVSGSTSKLFNDNKKFNEILEKMEKEKNPYVGELKRLLTMYNVRLENSYLII